MKIFKTVGVFFIIIGTISAVTILLNPILNIVLNYYTGTLWWLFPLSFIFGGVLYGIGTEGSIINMLKICGSILLIIGLCSAAFILFIELRLVDGSNTGDLWPLFIVCIIIGACAVIYAENNK